jgi:hypothetical protein
LIQAKINGIIGMLYIPHTKYGTHSGPLSSQEGITTVREEKREGEVGYVERDVILEIVGKGLRMAEGEQEQKRTSY